MMYTEKEQQEKYYDKTRYFLSSHIWQVTLRRGMLSDDGKFSYSTKHHFSQTN